MLKIVAESINRAERRCPVRSGAAAYLSSGTKKAIIPAAMFATLLLMGNSQPIAAAESTPEHANRHDDTMFAGHYYLTGVMETGSELFLRADGNFEWSLAYGAIDQFAHGTWRRNGDIILLTTAPPATDKPLFSYLEIEPWNDVVEEERLDRQYHEAQDEVLARCPFLNGIYDATTPVAVDDPAAGPIPTTILQNRAATALRDAVAARVHVEELAKSLMSVRRAEALGDEDMDRLRRALVSWRVARGRAEDFAMAAKSPPPNLDDPVLPAECTLPQRDQAPPKVTSGLAVRVFDLASGQGARNVQVTLHFADGREANVVTAGRGLAILSDRVSEGVTGVRLHADYAKGRDKTFAFASVTSGIIHFAIDVQQLAPPAFTTMRLSIAGQALVPDGLRRGRYERHD